jgi:hypothetical protein
MKTDELVTMLATGADPVPPHVARRRYALAIGAGALGATTLMFTLLGVRPDMAARALLPMFWGKLAFVAWLATVGSVALARVSRPGVPLGWVPAGLAAPVLGLWLLAAFILIGAESGQRSELIFGQTWISCPLLVALHSVPVFVAVVWAMKGLAPTRLRLAGAAAGFASGSVGALAYSLHCPELSAPFLGIWYLLGILIPTAVGALLGPRLLRW